MLLLQSRAGAVSDAWGIEALSVSHKGTTPSIGLAQRWGLRGGGFVDAVPKARPEYSEGHAQKSPPDPPSYVMR